MRILLASAPMIAFGQVLIENVPAKLEAPFKASSYQWMLGNEDIPGATNKFYILEQPQEADAGTYMVKGDNQKALFKTTFQRNVRIFINGYAPLGDSYDVKLPATISMGSPLGNVPIRYTLDGSEPTAISTQYTRPFVITNSCVIRAAIIIPERDSLKINEKP